MPLYYVKAGVGPTYIGKDDERFKIESHPIQTKTVDVDHPNLHELFPDKFVLVSNPGINGPIPLPQEPAKSTGTQTPVVEDAEFDEDELKKYTVDELRDFAEEQRIDVSGLNKKADIIAAFLNRQKTQ